MGTHAIRKRERRLNRRRLIICGAALAVIAPIVGVIPSATSIAEAAPARRAAAVSIPAPGSATASPQTSVSLRGVAPSSVAAVRVTGSRSGEHTGRLSRDADGKGVTFDPGTPFSPGEAVEVSTTVPVNGGRSDGFTFTVATPAPHPGLDETDPDLVDAGTTPKARAAAPGTDDATAAAAAAVSPQIHATRPDLRPPAVQINSPAAATAPGYLIATPNRNSTSDGGVMVYDDAGELVWFRPILGSVAFGDAEVITYRGDPAITWFEGTAPYGLGSYRGEWVVVDQTYREVGRIRMGNGYQADIHDIEVTDHGTAYLVGYNPLVCTGVAPLDGCTVGNVVLEGIVQEVDIDTGTVLWEWHSLDHVPLSDTYIALTGSPLDYFHINSVSEDVDGNVIISGRQASSIYKVDRTTGETIWTFGGKASTFTNYVNEPNTATPGPDFQHMALGLGNGNYSYFDNANRRGGPSRGAIVHLDVPTATATYTKELYHSPNIYGPSQGAMQPLANGNNLVAWGGLGTVTEYDEADQVVFDATLVGTGTYRQLRYEWSGTPSDPPTVGLLPGTGGARTVGASWNGDTRTASWRLLTGPSPEQLTAAAPPVDRTGFETDVGDPGTAAWVAVEALAEDGTVLGRSKPVRGAPYFAESTTTPVTGTYHPIVGDFGGTRNDDVLWYAPGTGPESMYVADGSGAFTSTMLPAVNGTYFPLVGDFVGDDRDEVIWWWPGNPGVTMWRFDGQGRTATPTTSAMLFAVPATGLPIVLDHRPAYGGSYDEIFWYGDGAGADGVQRFMWSTAGTPSAPVRSVSIGGSYQPVTGDFDGNGWADILWYAPGSTSDPLWLLSGGTAGSTGHGVVSKTVNGTYTAIAGNLTGDSTRDEILFATPGGGPDSVWSFDADAGHTSTSVTTSASGPFSRLRDANDRLMSWTGGTSPSIWLFAPGSSFRPSGNAPRPASARPVDGAYVGSGDRSSVFWYTPGTTPEILYAVR